MVLQIVCLFFGYHQHFNSKFPKYKIVSQLLLFWIPSYTYIFIYFTYYRVKLRKKSTQQTTAYECYGWNLSRQLFSYLLSLSRYIR